MATLTWKDSRIVADDMAPYDTTVMLVGPTTTIAEMVSETEIWCKQNEGKSQNLMIYCHGLPGFLHICKDNILYANVDDLANLKPYFDAVSIHACLVAKGNYGNAFCINMGQVLIAPVTGAVELQVNTGPRTIHGWSDDTKYDG